MSKWLSIRQPTDFRAVRARAGAGRSRTLDLNPTTGVGVDFASLAQTRLLLGGPLAVLARFARASEASRPAVRGPGVG